MQENSLLDFGLSYLVDQKLRKYDRDVVLEKYFDNECEIKYNGKHLNIPYDSFNKVLQNIFLDNMWVIDMIYKIYKEEIKLQDFIYKNYRTEVGNDGTIFESISGLDSNNKELATNTEKTESYSYTDISKKIEALQKDKKKLFHPIWKALDKIFWSANCYKEHDEITPDA